LKTGAFNLTRNFFQRVDNEKHQKNWHSHVPFMLLAEIPTQWQHPVASSEALDLLHWASHAVLYRRTAAAIKMTSKVGPFFLSLFHLLLPWWPLGQYRASSCLMAV
jgi:hypothetical protein